jgi:hypothetical protein
LLLLLAGSAVFVVGGLWMAGLFGPSKPGDAWIGWVCVLFFGLATVVIGGRLFDRRDQIVIDERGISWARWSEQTIPWSEVRNVREAQVRRNRFLCIDLAHPEWFPSSTFVGRLAGANRRLGFGDITISAMGTDKSFGQLKQAVFSRWQRPPVS